MYDFNFPDTICPPEYITRSGGINSFLPICASSNSGESIIFSPTELAIFSAITTTQFFCERDLKAGKVSKV
ncbi:hypothetical protein ES705_32394 [subsurface metagenome]